MRKTLKTTLKTTTPKTITPKTSLTQIRPDVKRKVLWLRRVAPKASPPKSMVTLDWCGRQKRPAHLLDQLLPNWTGVEPRGLVLTKMEKLFVEGTLSWWKRRIAESRWRQRALRGRLTQYSAHRFCPTHQRWKDSCVEHFLQLAERSAMRSRTSTVLVLDAPTKNKEGLKRLRVCDIMERSGTPLKAFVVDTDKTVVRAATEHHGDVVAGTRVSDLRDLTEDDLPDDQPLAGAYVDLCTGDPDTAMVIVRALEPLLAPSATLAVTLTCRCGKGGTFTGRVNELFRRLCRFRGFEQAPVNDSWRASPARPVATVFVTRRSARPRGA